MPRNKRRSKNRCHGGTPAAKMYRLARKRGVTHDEVKAFILERYNVTTSHDMTKEQCNEVRDVIRVLPVVPESERPKALAIHQGKPIIKSNAKHLTD